MIFHASIPARDPQRAASVLAELWGGFIAPFAVFPGSWIAVAGDERGTVIEVYPAGRVLHPAGAEPGVLPADAPPVRYSAFHLAVATKLPAEDVIAIGHREGWRAERCTRGNRFFDVIELWIDNATLIECLTDEMQADYLAFATPDNFRAMANAAPPR
ncbi:hypothetical protein [Caballeronia telluris]|uniref:Glyoxalase n=1 Tax=Caballeronia telluris TaxID=326475 RepID=A0A158FZR8_9BURK|nr:hypothetical protein [Caballeronia telluris]SAL24650.1 hypothetical protein AWB66_01381 [Caballeronia telluris]